MNARRLSEIVQTLLRARKMGARLNGKSVLERELKAWFDEPAVNCPELAHFPEQPAPPVYEIEMGLT